jgi:hypothetical protein
MANPILIVHGWSDNYESFVPLQQWLSEQFGPALQVFFANYESMEDHVTFDDLAAGLRDRLDDLTRNGELSLDPFSIDVVVHSTGGPVVRHWLYHYLMDDCHGDLTKCPVRRLLMFAPANFGSKLASEGKTALAKIFKGGVSHGFETGELILDGLELGSPELWEMAMDDLFSEKSLYPCDPNRGPFVFVFSGTSTYGALKGLVAPGANEDGSDGTIRASAASLNSIKIQLDCRNPAAPSPKVICPQNLPVAFRLISNVNHTEIIPRAGASPNHPTFELIRRCMVVNSRADHDALRGQFDDENKKFYNQQGDSGVHRHQQFVVHVWDELQNDVLDYRMDFHVIDSDATQSVWNVAPGQTSAALRALQKYQTLSERFQHQVITDVSTHSENSSYRTFFIDLDLLDALKNDMTAQAPNAFFAMNIDAAGPTTDLGYATDQLPYFRIEFQSGTTRVVPRTFSRQIRRR